eukprot:scaffold11433_cov148-Isochrysis_galbana.AAC.1
MEDSHLSRAIFAVGSSLSVSANDEGPAAEAEGGVGSNKGKKYTRGGGGGRGGRSKSGGYIGAKGMRTGCTGITMGWSERVRSGLCQQKIVIP